MSQGRQHLQGALRPGWWGRFLWHVVTNRLPWSSPGPDKHRPATLSHLWSAGSPELRPGSWRVRALTRGSLSCPGKQRLVHCGSGLFKTTSQGAGANCHA